MEYVDGTTKTVVKSVKPLPIMVVGYFFGKRYHLYRWFAVSAVIVGVTMFLLGFETKGKNKKYDETMIEIGIMWSLVALVMDGFVGSTQDNVRKKYKPSASALMLSSNLCALIISLFTDLVYSGEFSKAIEFQQKYPEVIWELMIASIANPFGNHFIFLMVSEFGALQCALVTTVRKFLTILVNSMWLGRWFTPFQILAVVGVFMGLLADSYVSEQEKRKELAAKQAKDDQKKKQ
uniref:Sugar phosphate transporter domain-containing protein n=1 Tax=Arcella intermedia TaxID=1963864 RepID=A0A6B2LDF2_9EUKA